MPFFNLQMDFIVFSDLHAHPFKFGSKWVVDKKLGPINSRLLDAVNCIRQVFDYAWKHDVKYVFFAGDMFHVPDRPPTEAVSAIFKVLADEMPKNISLFLLPGNHDIASKNGMTHALVPFEFVARVSTDYDYFVLDDVVRFHVVPYRESKSAYLAMANQAAENAKKGLFNVLISHIGIQGATVGSDYVLVTEQDVDLNEIPYQHFDLSLFGHFHEHQKLAPHTYFIGSTHQHNWGDADSERGFLHCSTGPEGMGFKRIPLESPKFHRLKATADLSVVKPGDFVMLTTDKDVSALKAKMIKELPHAAYLDVKPEKESTKQESIELPSAWSQAELLSTWVESKGPSKLAKKKLLNLGLELLGEANAEEE